MEVECKRWMMEKLRALRRRWFHCVGICLLGEGSSSSLPPLTWRILGEVYRWVSIAFRVAVCMGENNSPHVSMTSASQQNKRVEVLRYGSHVVEGRSAGWPIVLWVEDMQTPLDGCQRSSGGRCWAVALVPLAAGMCQDATWSSAPCWTTQPNVSQTKKALSLITW